VKRYGRLRYAWERIIRRTVPSFSATSGAIASFAPPADFRGFPIEAIGFMSAGAMVAIHAATAAGALIEAGVMRAVDARGA